MFNRTTGAVNPEVIEYWKEHYDIAYCKETNWPTMAPDLTGKSTCSSALKIPSTLTERRIGSNPYWIAFTPKQSSPLFQAKRTSTSIKKAMTDTR